MARIPDVDSLGARPIPTSQRGIATNPGAGVVGQALQGLGQTVGKIGNQMLERQDKFQYVAAKARLQKADIETRQALADDPDYSTYEARYTAAMTKARADATASLSNHSDRALFEQDTQTDVARGQADVANVVRAKRVSADKATLSQGLIDLRATARNAPDMDSRVAAINTAGEFVDAARDRGLLSAEDAGTLRRQWSSDYSVEQATMAMDHEDPVTARAIIESFGDKMDWRARQGLEERLISIENKRDARGGVRGLVGGAAADGVATAPIADPLRGKGRGPVPGGQYGAGRDYGSHHGVDFPAPNGTPIFGVAGVAKVSKSEKGGNIVVVTQPDGSQWKYMHLGKVAVKDGDAVTPDTQIGSVGVTGRSTGPHLHLEVWQGGKPVDPSKVIGMAQQSPQRHDLNQIYAQIDALADSGGWTPERRERWKQEADDLVARDERLANRREQAAMRSALDTVDQLGDNFTDPSQISNFRNLAPDDRIQLERIAKANRQPTEVRPNSEAVVTLHQLAYLAPDRFKGTDLRAYRGSMTAAEYDDLATTQARMIASPRSVEEVSHSQIWGTISRYGPDVGVDFSARKKGERDAAFAARRGDGMALFTTMKNYLLILTDGKRKPSDDEVKSAFDNAVMRFHGTDGGVAEKFRIPSLSKTGIAVPIADHDLIAAKLKARGLPYDDQTIARVYIETR